MARNDRLIAVPGPLGESSVRPGTGGFFSGVASFFGFGGGGSGRAGAGGVTAYGSEYGTGYNSPGGPPPTGQPFSLIPPRPVVVTEKEALAVSALWRGVNVIGDSLGQVPLDAVTVGSWTANADASSVLASAIDPTPGVLFRPEADFPRSATMQRLVWSLALHGNAYLLTDRSLTANPETVDQVWVLDPRRVQVWRDERGYRRFRLTRSDESFVDLPMGAVQHIPWVSLPGSDLGVGLLQAFGASGLRMAQALGAYLDGALMDGGLPSVLITVKSPALTQDQADAIKREWMARLSGKRVPAVVRENVEVKPIASDQMLTEQASALWNTVALEISNMLGLPPHMLNGAIPGSSLNYSNLESRQRDLISALRPWAVRIEEAFSMCLPRTQRAIFDLDQLARGETRTRYDSYEVALRAGFLTVDEVRQLENREPLPQPEPLPLPEVPRLEPVPQAEEVA